MFTQGFPNPADNGWTGIIVEGITDQQELNSTRTFFEHFVRGHLGDAEQIG